MKKIVEGNRSVSERAEEREKLLGEGRVTKCRVPKFALVLLAVVGVLLIAVAIAAVVMMSRSVGPKVPKCTAYVASGDTITVIDTIKNEVTAVLSIGFDYKEIAITPDETKIYMIGSGIALVINIATYKTIAAIDLGASHDDYYGMTITPDGTKIYVASSSNGGYSILAIDTAMNLVKVAIPVTNNEMTKMVITPNSTKVYVGSSVIDTITNKITAFPFIDPATAYPVIATPDGTRAYIYSNGNFLVINTATNNLTAIVTQYNLLSLSSYFRGKNSESGLATAVITPDGTRIYLNIS
jgi:DNA-binding beta-propeller fold protein YncE